MRILSEMSILGSLHTHWIICTHDGIATSLPYELDVTLSLARGRVWLISCLWCVSSIDFEQTLIVDISLFHRFTRTL